MVINNSMKKAMIIMLLSLGILFGLIFAYQAFNAYMIKQFMAMSGNPIVTVSATQVEFKPWQPKIKASGSLRAVHGVDVTTEIAGLIRTIYFTPGNEAKNNDLLVELNADSEIAELEALKATAELANITYERDKILFAKQSISKSTLDIDAADLKEKLAKVEQQVAIINKKKIKAPFNGRLGISAVNPGQYLNPGDKIVTLQSLDPIYIDFYVPQQFVVQIDNNQLITITTDTYPDKTFTGKITTIDPKVDPLTRNVQVEATISNPEHLLLPGMFATIEVDTGTPENYLTLPQTAVTFNPYGDIVFIVNETGKDPKTNKPTLTVNQVFVKVGKTRGNQVAILEGIKEGDRVVTSGQLKLRNGTSININNSVTPKEDPNPTVQNE